MVTFAKIAFASEEDPTDRYCQDGSESEMTMCSRLTIDDPCDSFPVPLTDINFKSSREQCDIAHNQCRLVEACRDLQN